jgi:hypothetical protein
MKGVGDAHDDAVHPAAVIAGEEPQHRADDTSHHHGADAHQQRNSGAIKAAGKHIPAQRVGAQQMLRYTALTPGGRDQLLGHVDLGGVPGGDGSGENGRQQNHHQNDEAHCAHRAFPEQMHPVAQTGLGRDTLFFFTHRFLLNNGSGDRSGHTAGLPPGSPQW